jgi:hypothetical protein
VIENDRQYQITRDAVDRFELALSAFEERPEAEKNVHPTLQQAMKDAILSQLEDLRREIREYDRKARDSSASRHAG